MMASSDANLFVTAARPAFIIPSSRGIKTHNNKALFAYTDDGLGRPNKIEIDKSKLSNISSTRKQNLPPSILPNGGKITMVGSGPGDPDLLTMAAYKLLIDPSILVISDRLVSPEILDIVKGEIKIARKLPGCAEEAQHEVSLESVVKNKKEANATMIMSLRCITLMYQMLIIYFSIWFSIRFTNGAKMVSMQENM